LPEVNVPGVTGFMSNVGDVNDMAKNSVYILHDSQRLAQFKKNVLQHAMKFDLQNILLLYENYYEKILMHSKKGNVLQKEQI